MPLVHAPAELPSWAELSRYEIHELAPGAHVGIDLVGAKNKLVLVEGQCVVDQDGHDESLAASGDTLDLARGTCVLVAAEAAAVVVELAGSWGDDVGGAGVFRVAPAGESAPTGGDSADYPKETTFDRHYHDCDEYWIIVRGQGTAWSEGCAYEVGPGDCVATQAGHHHDFSIVRAPVTAVFFETTMLGRKRRGHLWEHTHGPAEPTPDGRKK